MGRMIVATIVEGHGDALALPVLLRRIAGELFDVHDLLVRHPIRIPRSRLIKPPELTRAVELARLSALAERHDGDRAAVLVVFDADDDPPCRLAPQLLAHLPADSGVDLAMVLPTPEYETWFVASAMSLAAAGYLDLDDDEDVPERPEQMLAKKGWIERRFRGCYSPTVDQAKLTAQMDLARVRSSCPAFDKLCRELGRWLAPGRIG